MPKGLLDEYLTLDALAEELGVTTRTVLRWHAERRGPPRVKVGRKLMYRRAAVETWLRDKEVRDDNAPHR